jgi:hypothetical protein
MGAKAGAGRTYLGTRTAMLETEFRFNDRSNPYLFRDTLIKLLEAPVLEHRKLTAA